MLPAARRRRGAGDPVGASRPAGGAGLGGRCADADRPRGPGSRRRRGAGRGVRVLFVVLQAPGGLLESIRAFGVYVDRGVGSGPHTQPLDYYLRLLAYSSSGGLVWTEGMVLVLACVGLVAAALARNGFWPRYLGLYTVITLSPSPPSATRRPGTCCRSTPAPSSWRGTGRPRSSAPRGRVWHAGSWPGRCSRPSPPGRAGLAGELPLSGRPAQPLRLRAHRSGLPRLVAAHHRRRGPSPGPAGMLVKVVAGPYEQWPAAVVPASHDARRLLAHGCRRRPLDDAPVVIAAQDQAGPLPRRSGIGTCRSTTGCGRT